MIKWINIKDGLPRLKTVQCDIAGDYDDVFDIYFSDPVVCKYEDGYITTARFELFTNGDLTEESYFMNDLGEDAHGDVVAWMPYEWINEA